VRQGIFADGLGFVGGRFQRGFGGFSRWEVARLRFQPLGEVRQAFSKLIRAQRLRPPEAESFIMLEPRNFGHHRFCVDKTREQMISNALDYFEGAKNIPEGQGTSK